MDRGQKTDWKYRESKVTFFIFGLEKMISFKI